MAQLGAVIWRNRFWDAAGKPYGYAGGHQNHSHLEIPGTEGRRVYPGNPAYDSIVILGHALQRQRYRVGQHPAFGGVDPVHSGHGHYDWRAIDVNFGPAGTNDIERRAFDSLIPSVLRRSVEVLNLSLVKGVPAPRPTPPPPPEDDMPLDDTDKAWIAHAIGEKVAKAASRVIRHQDDDVQDLAELLGVAEEKRAAMSKRIISRVETVDELLRQELGIEGEG